MHPPPTKDRFQFTAEPGASDRGDYNRMPQGFQHLRQEETRSHHISFVPEFQAFSPEELRVADYEREPNTKAASSVQGFATWNNASLTAFGFGIIPTQPKHLIYGGDVIRIVVGTEPARDFVIHTSVVSPSSEFTKLAVQKDWKEAQNKEILLVDDDPDLFEIYQTWLYSGHLPRFDEYPKLIKTYILGDKLLDTNFKNAIIDHVIQRLCETSQFDLSLTNLIYNNTPPSSKLRRLLRDIYIYTANPTWLDESELEEDINGDFLKDLSTDQMMLRQRTLPAFPPFLGGFLSRRQYYHEAVAAKGTN